MLPCLLRLIVFEKLSVRSLRLKPKTKKIAVAIYPLQTYRHVRSFPARWRNELSESLLFRFSPNVWDRAPSMRFLRNPNLNFGTFNEMESRLATRLIMLTDLSSISKHKNKMILQNNERNMCVNQNSKIMTYCPKIMIAFLKSHWLSVSLDCKSQ